MPFSLQRNINKMEASKSSLPIRKKTNKQIKTKPNKNKTRPSFSIADTEQFQNNFLHNLAISSRDKENLKVCDPQMYSNHLSYESSVKVLIPIVWEKGKTPLPHI